LSFESAFNTEDEVPRRNPVERTALSRPVGVPPPQAQRRYSKSAVRDALRRSGGFISYAARRLGCHYNTVSNYLKRYPDLMEELNVIRESHIDLAESSLLQQVNEKNTQATIFYLECQGKKRGYVRNPALNLHAHVEAGSGTWADIMKRVAKECGGEVNAAKMIDITPTPGGRKQVVAKR
jgi:hypothetical protein